MVFKVSPIFKKLLFGIFVKNTRTIVRVSSNLQRKEKNGTVASSEALFETFWQRSFIA